MGYAIYNVMVSLNVLKELERPGRKIENCFACDMWTEVIMTRPSELELWSIAVAS